MAASGAAAQQRTGYALLALAGGAVLFGLVLLIQSSPVRDHDASEQTEVAGREPG